ASGCGSRTPGGGAARSASWKCAAGWWSSIRTTARQGRRWTWRWSWSASRPRAPVRSCGGPERDAAGDAAGRVRGPRPAARPCERQGVPTMRNTVAIENIEEMRRREGIDDVGLREEIDGLRVGDFVKLTFLTGTRPPAGE